MSERVFTNSSGGRPASGSTVGVKNERPGTVMRVLIIALADVDVDYAGYGVTNFDGTPFAGTHQFGFSSPPYIHEDLHGLTLRFEVPVRKAVIVAGYTYENYRLEDWQQAGEGPWVEALGADTLLRDSSRSYQWGNRLFNLGTYLAPSYDAHIGFVGLRYRF